MTQKKPVDKTAANRFSSQRPFAKPFNSEEAAKLEGSKMLERKKVSDL